MSQITLSKPPQGEQVIVLNEQKAPIHCTFSAQQAAILHQGVDIVFTFADGSSIIVRNYYGKPSNSDTQDAPENPDSSATLPPIIMNGETVLAPSLPLASQAAENADSPQHTENASANPANSPSTPVTPTSQNPVQNSSQSPAPNTFSANASQTIEGARFHDFDTSDLLDGINRLPGLELPWGQKFYESHIRHGGWDNDDSGGSIPLPPNVLPILTVDAANLIVQESGVKAPISGGDGNTLFPGGVSVSGKASATDADDDSLTYGLLQQGQVVQSLTTPYGTVTMNPDGTYTYTLNNTIESVNALKEGEHSQDSFTIIVSDGKGGTVSQVITVDIEGTNDRPELSFAEGNGSHFLSVRANSPAQTGAALTVTDADSDGAFYGTTDGKPNQSFSIADNNGIPGTSNANGGAVITTAYGTLTINADGTYSYAMNKDGAAITSMADGADYADTFTVTVTDVHGSTSTQNIVINIHKGNVGPVVTSTNTVALTEAGLAKGGNTEFAGTPMAPGQVTATDAEGDSLSFSVAAPSGNGYSIAPDTSAGIQLIHTPYGNLVFHMTTGAYTYTLDNTKTDLNTLKTGDSKIETFPVTVDDGHGGTVTTNITVTITGTNDAPELLFGSGTTGNHTGNNGLTDAAAGSANLTATGKLKVTDPDSDGEAGQTVSGKPSQSFSIAAGGDSEGTVSSGTDGGATFTTAYGTLTIDKAGNYTYKVDTASDKVIALGTSQSHTETFIVQIKDAHGAISGTQEIKVEITGKGDPPKISGAADTNDVRDDGVQANTNTNDDGKLTTGGTLTAEHTDNDVANDITFGLSNNVGITGGTLGTVTLDGSGKTLTTDYGTLTLTPTNSQVDGKFGCKYLFELDKDAIVVNALPNGKTLTLTFTVEVTDASGTRTEDVSVTITGTNDRPTISSVGAPTAVVEDGSAMTSGQVIAADVDTGDSLTYNIVNISDKVQILMGEYGRLEIRPDGTYTYYLDNSKAQSLAQGQKGEDTFTVRVTDTLGAYTEETLNISITGGDDTPVLGNLAASITEDNGGDAVAVENPSITNGRVTVSDVDAWDMDSTQGGFQTFTLTGADVTNNSDGSLSVQGMYGLLTLRADGTYDYVLNKNDDLAIQSLNVEKSLTDRFTISVTTGHTGFSGSSTSGELTITINGSNDNPVVIAGTYDLKVDNILLPVKEGQLVISDVDDKVELNTDGSGSISSKNHTFYFKGGDGTSELQSMTGKFGVLTLNQFTGKYTYTLNQYAEGLATGGTEKFTVWVKDAHGGATSQEIMVDVGKLSDCPSEPGPDYKLTGDDLAVTEDHFASGTTTNVQATNTATPEPAGSLFGFNVGGRFTQTVTGKYGTITINDKGEYTYTLNNSLNEVQGLGEGKTLGSESFQLWGTGSSEITVTITGTNDKPTLSFTAGSGSHSLTQQDGEDRSVTGTAEVADVDKGDTHEFWLDEGCTLKTVYYKFTVVDGKITGFETTIEANAHYFVSVDNNGVYTLTYLQDGLHLTKDDTQNVTFDIYVKDQSGADNAVSDKITVNATINGQNANPTWGTVLTNEVKEDDPSIGSGANITAIGKFLDDGGVGDDTGSPGLFFSINGTASLCKGKYGTLLIINAATGEYIYTLDNSLKTVQELGEGKSLTDETFTIVVTDKHGGTAETSFTVTVNGTNDAPTLDALTSLHVTATSDSDSTSSVESTAHGTDKDVGDTLTYSFTGKDGNENYKDYGTFVIDPTTGKYTFTLDNSKDAVKNLSDSEVKNLDFTITVSDGNGGTVSQDVTVNIKGDNDAPTVDTVTNPTPSVTEGGASATGTITGKDAEGETLSYELLIGTDSSGKEIYGESITTDYGTMYINKDTGVYSYQPKSDIADFHAGSTPYIDKFTIYVRDGHGAATSQDITVTVRGVGDPSTPPNATFAGLFDAGESLDSVLPALSTPENSDNPLYQDGADTINITEMAGLLLSEAWADSGIQNAGAEYAMNYDNPAPDAISVHPAVEIGAQEQVQHKMTVAVLMETGGL